MARIRSVHPGFFTDEALVSVSMAARLLFIGAGIEADDKGVFEWKPLTLKMRLFPADNVDVTALLAELVAVGAVEKYEIEGRYYGAIRNFRKFQRPKTPNDTHPAPDHIRTYVGLSQSNSEAFPQKGEISPQMEEGGDKGSSVANATGVPPPDPDAKFWADAKAYLTGAGVKNSGAIVGKLVRDHGKTEAARLISRAQIERAVEPISFMAACAREVSREAESVTLC